MEKNGTGHQLPLVIYKNKQRWSRDLNRRLETIKFLKENIGSKLIDVSFIDKFFFNMMPKQKQQKQK